MQIYLAKPGGQKEGPFSLDQINRDLAAKKYSGNDYWAWYEGLPNWMPLHSLPGVTGKAAAVVAAAAPEPAQTAAPPKAAQAAAPKAAAPAAVEPAPKPAAPPKPAAIEIAKPEPAAVGTPDFAGAEVPLKPVPSGLPFAALDQIFIFTTGQGRSVFESQLATQKLEDTVGEKVDKIRDKATVSVVGHVDAGVEMMHDGSIPDKAWRAIAAIKPAVAEQAKAGAYQFCVRTLLAESNDVITLLLFYKKSG